MNTDLVILANWWTSSSWLLNSCFTIKSERVSSSSSMRKNFSKFITEVKSWETPKAKQESTKTKSTGAIFAGGDWATVSPREQLCVEPPQDVASTTCCVLYVAIDLRSQSLQSDAHNKSMVKSMLSYISCRSTRIKDIIVLPLKFISDRNFIVQILVFIWLIIVETDSVCSTLCCNVPTNKAEQVCIHVHFMYGVTREAHLFSVEMIRKILRNLPPPPSYLGLWILYCI